MSLHRVHLDAIPPVGDTAVIEGDEAKHAARVKRLEPGHHLQLLDGRGSVARGVVLAPTDLPAPVAARRKHEWLLPVRVEHIEHAEPVRPRLHLYTATPKGARLDDMIDALSQTGAASWSPLETRHCVVDPRDTKLTRVQRVAVEASKQCGRPWVLDVGAKASLPRALDAGVTPVVLADATGTPYRPTGAAELRLLIGPEGGWTREELAMARDTGARIHAFGPHVMRIETAAVVASAVILAAESMGGV
jgi:16S rRNA (uracil1498-N3)-methyltransferase